MDLTPKQQTSEAIRQAETIIITTGQHPSVDQVAAVLSLSAILRKFGKKVSAVVSDPLPQQMAFLNTTSLDRTLSGLRDFVLKVDVRKSEVDKLRYEVQDGKLNIFITPFKGGFAPSDVTFDYGDYHYDLAIVLGVPSKARVDRVLGDNPTLFGAIPVVNLDFHRSNENYGAVNLIEPTASSLCEILVATSESLQTGLIDADIATIMLTGLMASTDRFTASHTTSKSLTVAAQLMAAGARQQTVVRGLYRDNREARPEHDNRSDQIRPEGGNRPGGRDDSRPQAPRPEARPEQAEPEHRQERPERTDRPHRAETRENRSEQTNSQPSSVFPMARREQPKPEAAPRPEQDNQPAEHKTEDTKPPEHSDRPERPDSSDEAQAADPIIQPGHIELSDAGEDDMPLVDRQPADLPPMADFAAAAEILRQRNDDSEPEKV